MSIQIRYGINPQESATITDGNGLQRCLRILPGISTLSATNMIDIAVGVRALIPVQQGAAIVKHGCLVALCADDNMSVSAQIQSAFKVSGHIAFGTLVLKGDVTLELCKALSEFRFHVLVATRFTEAAAKQLAEPENQDSMLGLSSLVLDWDAVEYSPKKIEVATLFNDASLVNEVKIPSSENLSLVTNSALSSTDRSLIWWYLGLLRDMRTISSFLIRQRTLLKAVYGFQDSLESIDYLFSHPRRPQLTDVDDAWLVTDGCFGPKEPKELLSRAPVKNILLCGKKNQRSDILDFCLRNGVRAVVTEQRFFCHM